MNVAFIVTGGEGRGLGHVMRCLTIADTLKTKNARCTFYINNAEAVQKIIQERGYETTGTPDIKSSPPIFSETPDLIVADSYDISEDYLNRLTKIACTAYVDDFAKKNLPVHIVIGNGYCTSQDYINDATSDTYQESHQTILCGPEHVPIRPGFSSIREGTRSEVKDILIAMGGEDAENFTCAVLKSLGELEKEVTFHVMLGAAFRHRKALDVCIQELRYSVKIYQNINPVDLFSKIDLAVIAGASTTWELAASGVPMVLGITARNQEKLYAYQIEKKIGIGVGWYKDASSESIRSAVCSLYDMKRREEMSKRSRTLVDGNGAMRIANAIIDILDSSRKQDAVTLRRLSKDWNSSDSKLIWEWRNDPITREMSRTTNEISWDSHKLWYEKRSNKDGLLMAELGGVPMCMVRLDTLEDTGIEQEHERAEISINLSPDYRGKGLSSKILKEALLYAKGQHIKNIIAEIKTVNTASIKLFEKHGFVLQQEEDGLRTYFLTL